MKGIHDLTATCSSSILAQSGKARKCQDLKSCLHELVECNNVEAVKSALQKGALVNTKDSLGVTPLHIAAMSNNRLQCLKELLKSESADIDAKTYYKDTPVIYSCKTSSDIILKTLIEHGADVNSSNFGNLSPLHYACWKGCLKVVKLLIKAGANVNAKTIQDWTVLHEATSYGNFDVCYYLLQHGADANIPNREGLLPLHSAANCEVYDLIKSNTRSDAILKYCAFPGPNGVDLVNRSILCLALDTHNKALVERVLKSRLPDNVLNCPVVVKQPIFFEDYRHIIDEQHLFNEKLVLLTPFCYFLNCKIYSNDLDVLKMLISNNLCVTNTFISDALYIPGPIEVMLNTEYKQIDSFKIISTLLENGINEDNECNEVPTKIFELCFIKNIDNSIFMLLLKSSNVIEPEDILRWIIDNRHRDFIQSYVTPDLLYELLVLSPYVIMPLYVHNFFSTLPVFTLQEIDNVKKFRPVCKQSVYTREEINVTKKIRQICEQPVRPLTNYCRSIVRRQLHFETRGNRRQFMEKLNSLPVPKTVISYLKFSEIKFTVSECTERVNCQIVYDS